MCKSCRVADRFLKHDGFTVAMLYGNQAIPVMDMTTRKPRRFVSMALAEIEAKRLTDLDKLLPSSAGMVPVTYKAMALRAMPIHG